MPTWSISDALDKEASEIKKAGISTEEIIKSGIDACQERLWGGKVPSEQTLQALRESEAGDVIRHDSVESFIEAVRKEIHD